MKRSRSLRLGLSEVAFTIRRTKVDIVGRIAGERTTLWVITMSPLVVAVVVITGLIFLGAENLAGLPSAQQRLMEHSRAIGTLFFRH